MTQPAQNNKPYNPARINYWSMTLKFLGFFFAGLLIVKSGMKKEVVEETAPKS